MQVVKAKVSKTTKEALIKRAEAMDFRPEEFIGLVLTAFLDENADNKLFIVEGQGPFIVNSNS